MCAKNVTSHTIIEELVDYAKRQVSQEQAPLFIKFIKLYYSHMPLADFKNRSLEDLYGSAFSHWELMLRRAPDELKVKVFNPRFEEYGWQSTHTIIQIATADMPFLVDTMRMEINRMNLTMHLMVHSGGVKVERDKTDTIVNVLPYYAPAEGGHTYEAPIHMEIDRQTDRQVLTRIKNNLIRVLNDVRSAVDDWKPMQNRLEQAIKELDASKMNQAPAEVNESKSFLQWLLKDHFTFLGFRDYTIIGEGDDMALQLIPDSGLGVLRDETHSKMLRQYSQMPEQARKLALSKDQILIISKTNTMATVHRAAYTDYVGVKRFDEEGNLIGERRFIGLYTSEAYRMDPRNIPFLRHRVTSVLKKSGLPMGSHAAKDLLNILATLPRDDLMQATKDELFEICSGILHMQERRCTRLFARQDAYGRFISFLVYVPRENFNTDLVGQIKDILQERYNAWDITYSTYVSESILARIHYVVRIDPSKEVSLDAAELEEKIVGISESWQDSLYQQLIERYGEEQGNELVSRYRYGFPAGYREVFEPRSAVFDIDHIENLPENDLLLGMSFYRPVGAAKDAIRFKLYRRNNTVPLSDALPMLENMGLRVIGEQPYLITLKSKEKIWINDFEMRYSSKEPTFEVDDVKLIFQEAFQMIWMGEAENDAFNRLVLEAEMNWREVSVLRAYTKYFRQIGFTFSEQYIASTLIGNKLIARLLVELFKIRFDPALKKRASNLQEEVELQIEKALDEVAILDEDRILRRYLDLIHATLRTNFFQVTEQKKPKEYLSFKLDPKTIPELPLPLPSYEIFVYSPHFEGVHLRYAKVARGGIRWSDRREDFRTEVLGLMKAQQVKNALIIPAGAKGGFYPKCLPPDGSREEILQEGIACYENFIRGLLDVTDNLENGEIVTSDNTVCYDGHDPYIVVAADKGTATFSDIANRIAIERNYWLGDAFASGGSTGYDHKKMAITARGAWVSAERHFQNFGVNVDKTEITVVGIGDMSGDVFGNGMLMSPHIKLVAAFNHMHIFLDPNPDAKASFTERKRLFELPRSSWNDYDRSLISAGGGVFSRSAKAIYLSSEVRALLDTDKERMVPSELIQTILKAPVDLLWNGGIGTYVKASTETHAEVGDRSNDAVRVDGKDVRARVVSEGGNLGLTQLGRVEYEMAGGRLNTDFIDNSAGVDCSDHEVNIKILLNGLVSAGDLTNKQRNALMVEMTDEVASLVLQDNYQQNQVISIAAHSSSKHLGLYMRYIQAQEKAGKLDRELEFLPTDKAILERRSMDKGMTRPELSVLLAYSKNILKDEIINTDLVDDAYLCGMVENAFPTALRQRYAKQMRSHYLANDIIATEVSNSLVSEMGIAYVYQMQDETGASISAIIRAYMTASKVFDLQGFYTAIESLDYQVETEVQYNMMLEAVRLVRRATRWFLRNRREQIDIESSIGEFSSHVSNLFKRLPKLLLGADKARLEEQTASLVEKGIPEDIALKVASTSPIYHALNIVEAATAHDVEVFRVAKIYFMLVDRLDLLWFRDQINAYPVSNRWSVLAKAAYKGDLDWIQRELTVGVLLGSKARSIPGKINAWFAWHEDAILRWQSILTDLRSLEAKEFAILFVALRELLDLAQTSTSVRNAHQQSSTMEKEKDDGDSRSSVSGV